MPLPSEFLPPTSSVKFNIFSPQVEKSEYQKEDGGILPSQKMNAGESGSDSVGVLNLGIPVNQNIRSGMFKNQNVHTDLFENQNTPVVMFDNKTMHAVLNFQPMGGCTEYSSNQPKVSQQQLAEEKIMNKFKISSPVPSTKRGRMLRKFFKIQTQSVSKILEKDAERKFSGRAFQNAFKESQIHAPTVPLPGYINRSSIPASSFGARNNSICLRLFPEILEDYLRDTNQQKFNTSNLPTCCCRPFPGATAASSAADAALDIAATAADTLESMVYTAVQQCSTNSRGLNKSIITIACSGVFSRGENRNVCDMHKQNYALSDIKFDKFQQDLQQDDNGGQKYILPFCKFDVCVLGVDVEEDGPFEYLCSNKYGTILCIYSRHNCVCFSVPSKILNAIKNATKFFYQIHNEVEFIDVFKRQDVEQQQEWQDYDSGDDDECEILEVLWVNLGGEVCGRSLWDLEDIHASYHRREENVIDVKRAIQQVEFHKFCEDCIFVLVHDIIYIETERQGYNEHIYAVALLFDVTESVHKPEMELIIPRCISNSSSDVLDSEENNSGILVNRFTFPDVSDSIYIWGYSSVWFFCSYNSCEHAENDSLGIEQNSMEVICYTPILPKKASLPERVMVQLRDLLATMRVYSGVCTLENYNDTFSDVKKQYNNLCEEDKLILEWLGIWTLHNVSRGTSVHLQNLEENKTSCVLLQRQLLPAPQRFFMCKQDQQLQEQQHHQQGETKPLEGCTADVKLIATIPLLLLQRLVIDERGECAVEVYGHSDELNPLFARCEETNKDINDALRGTCTSLHMLSSVCIPDIRLDYRKKCGGIPFSKLRFMFTFSAVDTLNGVSSSTTLVALDKGVFAIEIQLNAKIQQQKQQQDDQACDGEVEGPVCLDVGTQYVYRFGYNGKGDDHCHKYMDVDFLSANILSSPTTTGGVICVILDLSSFSSLLITPLYEIAMGQIQPAATASITATDSVAIIRDILRNGTPTYSVCSITTPFILAAEEIFERELKALKFLKDKATFAAAAAEAARCDVKVRSSKGGEDGDEKAPNLIKDKKWRIATAEASAFSVECMNWMNGCSKRLCIHSKLLKQMGTESLFFLKKQNAFMKNEIKDLSANTLEMQKIHDMQLQQLHDLQRNNVEYIYINHLFMDVQCF